MSFVGIDDFRSEFPSVTSSCLRRVMLGGTARLFRLLVVLLCRYVTFRRFFRSRLVLLRLDAMVMPQVLARVLEYDPSSAKNALVEKRNAGNY